MADSEKPASKKRIIFILIPIVLGCALLAVGGYLLYRHITSPYTSYEVVYTENVVMGESTDYIPYIEGYLRVSRDGAEAVDSDGLRLWNVSYSMNSPVVAVCGKYASVADLGAKLLYLMDGDGGLSKLEMPYKIEEVECSLAGVTAVRMNDGSDDYIRLVDISGNLLAELKTVEDKDGFPVDMALSSNGKKLVTSYLTVDGEKAAGSLTFYNFGNVGKNYVNNVTGIFKFDTVVPAVKFLGENRLCAFFDTSIQYFSFEEVPKEGKKLEFTERILNVYASETGVAVMQENTTEGFVSHTEAYDTTGNMIFESNSSNELSGVMFYGKNLLFYNEFACQILNRDGIVVYNGNFGGLTADLLLPGNGKDRLILFSNGTLQTIKLTKGSTTE